MIHPSIHTGLQVVALVAASSSAAPVSAQDLQQVSLSGSADQICVLAAPELLTGGQLDNFAVPAGSVYSVQELSDPSTLTTRAARLTLSMDAMCNSAHRIVVTSENSGLWHNGDASTASGFGSAVPYRLDLSWADANETFQAEASVRQERIWELLVARPNAGEIELDFQIEAGATNAGTGAPMIAGGYSDVVTVTVETQ